MEAILAISLITAVILTALSAFNPAPRHRHGLPVAQIQARLAAESARTFLPLRGW